MEWYPVFMIAVLALTTGVFIYGAYRVYCKWAVKMHKLNAIVLVLTVGGVAYVFTMLVVGISLLYFSGIHC